jgi:hypothetical protein
MVRAAIRSSAPSNYNQQDTNSFRRTVRFLHGCSPMRKASWWLSVTNHIARRSRRHSAWETALLKLPPGNDRNSALADEVYS